MRLHNGKLDIFRQLFGLVAFDKARDNNFVVRDEGTSRQWTAAAYWEQNHFLTFVGWTVDSLNGPAEGLMRRRTESQSSQKSSLASCARKEDSQAAREGSLLYSESSEFLKAGYDQFSENKVGGGGGGGALPSCLLVRPHSIHDITCSTNLLMAWTANITLISAQLSSMLTW